ncbi:MAG: LicD family protein [Solobacterium sp.]|nr:LicD family protein [Solobacterium sp.]
MKKIGLEEQKKIMLEMLVDFAAFCDAHQLDWFLTGGSMLGAVRHHGFIPWDDDIDVGMPRRDYERFRELYPQEKTRPEYEFVTYHEEPNLYVSSGKLHHTGTVLREAADSELELGIYLDIFPLDNAGDTMDEAKKLFEDTMEIRHRIDVQNWKIIKERAWYKNAVIAVLKAMAPKGIRPQLIKELDETCRRFEGPEMTQYVGFVCAAHNGLKEILHKEWFSEYIKVPFEEYTFQIPARYDEILSGFYNSDYMQLPPPEKQKSHHVYDAEWKDAG